MPSPFPGMDPYLEHPDRWSTVHNRLIVALADQLAGQLLPRYQVDIEKRIYEVLGPNTLWVGRADVTVQQPRQPRATSAQGLATASPETFPVRISLPLLEEEEVREAYLEVKEVATQRVVTVIEILSPTNKRGQGRQKYEDKRHCLLTSQTHLVEIDLLRDGDPFATEPGLNHDYRILCSRAGDRPLADLYAFNLPDPLPLFPMPLLPGDSEPIVDLKPLIDQTYDRSGYAYFVDYAIAPEPPLSTENTLWVTTLLAQHFEAGAHAMLSSEPTEEAPGP